MSLERKRGQSWFRLVVGGVYSTSLQQQEPSGKSVPYHVHIALSEFKLSVQMCTVHRVGKSIRKKLI